jgi:hypothetical protein
MRQGTAFALAVRSRFFVFLTLGYLLAMGAQVGTIAHMYTRGVAVATPLQASFAVSVLATLSVIGRLIGGFIIGRVSIKKFGSQPSSAIFGVRGDRRGRNATQPGSAPGCSGSPSATC